MWTLKKTRRSLGILRPFGRIHRKWLVRGTLATIGLVLLRLALPWPLKGVIEVLVPKPGHAPPFLPAWADPVLWFAALYVVLMAAVGVSEMMQRVCMAKFATHTVHDLRAAAVRGAARQGTRGEPGDLVARIIGDVARVKESVKGILIHVSQNGLLYLGVSVVFVFISPRLSLFFLLGGLIAVWVGLRTSSRVAAVFRKQRKKEGAFAAAIQEGLETDGPDLDDLNRSSAEKDVRVTKMITRSSLVIHIAFAATTSVALWVGAREMQAGLLSAGDLFLFITYALTVHQRVIQVGRQLARGGKVVACVDRIGALLGEAGVVPPARPLATELKLEGVVLGPSRIRSLDLALRAGSRVAVLGGTGSGKSSLLRLLAGVEGAEAGKISWDGEDLTAVPAGLALRVGFLPQEPVFSRRRVWRVLGLPGPESPADDAVATLKRIGAWKILRRMPKGLRERVGTPTLSRNEARLLRLGAILLGSASVWVLDSPFDGIGLARARRCLDEALTRLGTRTLVVGLARPLALERFDRVISLRDGRIDFDGDPREWKERKLLKK